MENKMKRRKSRKKQNNNNMWIDDNIISLTIDYNRRVSLEDF
jgi:hypothetical protein